MGKKRRRKQKPSATQAQTLEKLLRNGEAVLYGQVCWSIANRGTDIPGPGDVITLERGDEEGGHRTKEFRLTRKSIENVERCLGMRTCGEAVDLFAEREEMDATGECPNGHQEAAFAFMMHGIRPTEPCPQCGEIPEFGNTTMSPDLYTDGPVKGVDGEEYSTCPRCGEDFLQLEGSSIAEWGWKIVCLDCGWEMKQAEGLDIAQYCTLMEEVKSKVASINQLMEVPELTIRTRVESVSLQLRMLLELLVFSSLVSNQDVWRKSKKELRSSQNISKRVRELKRLHPHFYPRPLDLRGSNSGQEPSDRTEGFLSEDRLIEVYGQLGNILHAENPMGEETDLRYFIDSVPGWVSEVVNLLECHKVYLYHRPDEFYLIKMFGDVDGELTPVQFKTTAAGETKCAWPDCVSSSARQYCEYIRGPWGICGLTEMEPAQTQGKGVAEKFDDERWTSSAGHVEIGQ